MADLKLFQMRYKVRYGVETGFIEASSLEKAEELGRRYCCDNPGHLFLSVKDPILVREQPEEPVSEPDGDVGEGVQASAKRRGRPPKVREGEGAAAPA